MSILNGYDSRIVELEEIFQLIVELRPRNKWEFVFIDDEWRHDSHVL